MFRGGAGVASCFGPDYQNFRVEKCTDITVSVCEEHTQVVSSCDTWEASNTVQQASPASLDKFGLQVAAGELAPGMQTPSTVLVWIDGAWNGHAVSCKSMSAGAVQLRNHAIGTPKVDQWETLDHRCKAGLQG